MHKIEKLTSTQVTQHDFFRQQVSEWIGAVLRKNLPQLPAEDFSEIYSQLQKTQEGQKGDLTLALFQLAKNAKQSPPQLGQYFLQTQDSQPECIQSLELKGPYLNISLKDTFVFKQLSAEVTTASFFQKKLTQHTPKMMMEYSQPNTHKELHVGHMRNLCLGDALVRLHRYCGYSIISSTFPGDVGTHVAKCLWYLKNHQQGPIPTSRKGAWLGQLYSKAHNLLEDQRGTDQEEKNRQALTSILGQLEKKQGEYYELWKETRQWSNELMQDVYRWAQVEFDQWYWESEVDSASVALIKHYAQKGLFKEDQGCLGMDLSEWGLGFCMLLKSDGNGLYATKDIELARRKFQEKGIDKSIYIVDKRQEHHFKQVFKVLELMGFEQAKNCFHLAYDFVELPDGAMSSRKGNIVPLQTLIDSMAQKIKDQFLQKYAAEWSTQEIETVAHDVARGAIKYGMNRIDPSKKIVFDLNEWLKLDGESGPYIQYAVARIESLLQKNQLSLYSTPKLTAPKVIQLSKEERTLLFMLIDFNTLCVQSAQQFKPSLLCGYLYDVAKAFSSFYAACPIQGAAENEQKQRLLLSYMTGKILTQGLALLGITAPRRM
jgi:arginyl-tRNA synthetase